MYRGADHAQSTEQVNEGERMQACRCDTIDAEPQILIHCTLRIRDAKQSDDDHTRGNWCSFKILHLSALIGQRHSSNVEARQTADAAHHEKHEDRHIPAASHTKSKAEYCGSHTKRNDVGERIEICAK